MRAPRLCALPGVTAAVPSPRRCARRRTYPRRHGFTLMEMVVVLALVGLAAAMIGPRLRVSSGQRVRAAAVQLQQDLDLVRMRALTTRRATRLVFNVADQTYEGFMADRGTSTFAQSASEQDSLGAFRQRTLPDGVVFGRADTPDLPGFAGAGDVTLPDSRADFDTRGIVQPFGTRGVIYLTHRDDPGAVAAVALTPGAAIRVHVYNGGSWR